MNDGTTVSRKPFPVIPVTTAVVALLAFFGMLAFPNAIPDATLDASWSAAFAYFFKHRLHAGTEYIFTYGPLGFLLTAYFDPQTFALKWLYEVLLKAYVIAETIRLSRLPDAEGKPASWWRCLIPLGVAALTFAFSVHPGFVYSTDAFAYIVFLVLATAPIRDENLSFGRICVTVFVVAILSLAKATLLALAIPVVIVCALRVAMQEKKRPIWQSPLVLFPAVWLVLWFLLGQGPGNILSYFLGSLSVATGYNEAMAFNTPVYRNSIVPLIAAIAAIISLLVTLRMQADALPKSRQQTPLNIIYLLLVALILLLAWKHGFTRGGNHTKITFLALAYIAPFLLVVLPGGPKSRPRNILLALATVCATFGVLRGDEGWFHLEPTYLPIASTFRTTVNPLGTIHEQQQALETNRTTAALPQVKSTVGNAPIALWSYEQGVLLLNDLHYMPHPSFQGYNDYTRYLQEKDLAFWQSDKAPEYLLFKAQTIDFRYPTLDGGPAYAAMLQRYAPVLEEQGYFLMRRRDLPAPVDTITAAREKAEVQTVAPGAKIDVPPAPPGMLQMISIKLTPTPAGITRRMLFKPAEVYLTAQAQGSDRPQLFRLIPTMAEQGFILNPLLATQEQVAALYGGTPIQQIESISVDLPPDAAPCFSSQIEVRLYTVPIGTAVPSP